MILSLSAAENFDLGYPADRRKQRPKLVQRNVAKFDQRTRVRGQAVGQHRKNGGIHAPNIGGRSLRQVWHDLVDRRLDLQQGGHHVYAPIKIDRYFGAAAARRGAKIAHAGNRSNRLFDRQGHLDRHAFGRTIAGIEADDDSGKANVRKERHGQIADLRHTTDHQHRN